MNRNYNRAFLRFVGCAIVVCLAAAIFPSAYSAPKPKPKAKSMAPAVPPGKPEIFRFEPRGIQRGVAMEIKVIGTNLIGLTGVRIQQPGLTGELVREDEAATNAAWLRITAGAKLARGAYEISVHNTTNESGRIKLHVDDLPQVYEEAGNPAALPKLPVSYWGVLNPAGNTDELEFDARSGQSLVFDIAAKSIGSKANVVLSLFDAKGVLLASNNGLDGGDPLLHAVIPSTGRYKIRVGEEMAAGSAEHFYRLSVGGFPEVVACYPLGIPVGKTSEVELIGYNLPAKARVAVPAASAGTANIPVDEERYRVRKALSVVVGGDGELAETEPNDDPARAMALDAPVTVNGRFWNAGGGTDDDVYKFHATKGRRWIIETSAAQRGSPADTRLEILDGGGKPVERLKLQAVRNSAINFRAMDSNNPGVRLDNWTEMELNEYYYMQGDVARIFRMPQGPDSDMLMYSVAGKRRAYFDTSAAAHALDEPGYIVEPHQPNEKLESNGLPVYPVYFENDDDAERKLGTDSIIHFSPPEDGDYFVRVTETQGHFGERFAYRLVLRESRPDFKVTLGGASPTVDAGSGKAFTLNVDRADAFEGEVKVEISDLPAGFTVSTPLVIEAGHGLARGTLHAAADAMAPADDKKGWGKVTASAMIDGKLVTKEVNNFGAIKLGAKPKLFVAMETPEGALTTNNIAAEKPGALEVTLAPGASVPVWLKVLRNGHEDLVTFTVENLPYGVIVDNIGLSGVLIPKGESERQIFLTAAKWVEETDLLCYAVENQAGGQTSLPFLLHVRKTAAATASSAR